MSGRGAGVPHETPGRVADVLAIQDLVHAYAEGIDDGDRCAVAELFTEDCVFRAFAGPKGEARGRAELEVLLDRLLTTFTSTSHHVSGTRVDFHDDDTASGRTGLQAWHSFPVDRPDGLLWGRYVDRFVRTGAGWRFRARELQVSGQRDFPFAWIPRTRPAAVVADRTDG